MISAPQLAKALGLTTSDITNLTRYHDIPHVRIKGNKPRYVLESVVNWIEVRGGIVKLFPRKGHLYSDVNQGWRKPTHEEPHSSNPNPGSVT